MEDRKKDGLHSWMGEYTYPKQEIRVARPLYAGGGCYHRAFLGMVVEMFRQKFTTFHQFLSVNSVNCGLI